VQSEGRGGKEFQHLLFVVEKSLKGKMSPFQNLAAKMVEKQFHSLPQRKRLRKNNLPGKAMEALLRVLWRKSG